MQPVISASVWIAVSLQRSHWNIGLVIFLDRLKTLCFQIYAFWDAFLWCTEKCLIGGRKNQWAVQACACFLAAQMPISSWFEWFCTTLLVLASAETLLKGCLTPWPMKVSRSLQEQEVRNMYQMISSAFQQWVIYELPKPLVLPRSYIPTAVFINTWTSTSVLIFWHVFLLCFKSTYAFDLCNISWQWVPKFNYPLKEGLVCRTHNAL